MGEMAGIIVGLIGLFIIGFLMWPKKLKKKAPKKRVFITDSDAKAFDILLSNNPGNDKKFEHCGKVWTTNNQVPPVVMCPICRTPIICVRI